jgi:hypothetical protein
MTAIQLDLLIEQGADFSAVFPVGYDITGFASALQIKYAPDYPYAVLTLTTGDGLAIDGPAGTVTATIPKSVTATLKPVRYVYDLKVFGPTCLASRAFQGTACVSPQVTDLVICPPRIVLWDSGGRWDEGLSWDPNGPTMDWDAGENWDAGLSWDQA